MKEVRKWGENQQIKHQKKALPNTKTLTPKQARFCQEYVIDLNATQAAKRAGYSEKTAESRGSQLLTNVKVSNYIEKLLAERSARTQITADRVLRELARVAFTPMTELARWTSEHLEPVPSEELNADQAASVKTVKFKKVVARKGADETEFIEVGISQHDKLGALEKLAKHLGLYDARSDSEGQSGLERMIEALTALRNKEEE